MNLCFLADGGHVNCVNWINHLSTGSRHRVSLISFEPVSQDIHNVRVHEIRSPPHLRKLKYIWGLPRMRKILRNLRPDLVIGYRVSSYGFLAAAAGHRPLIVVAQGSNIDNPEHSILKDLLIKYAISHADMCHAWGQHMASRFMALGADSSKVFVMPRGVDTDRFALAPFHDRPFSMVMTRGLKAGYHLEVPFYALASLRESGYHLNFHVLGDGPIRNTLEQLAKTLCIDRQVFFHGAIPNRDLPEILSRSQAYVSPVPSDGVSASLLEAMACGLIPMVVSNPANRQWIQDGVNGFLFRDRDPHALASILRCLVDGKVDVETIRRHNREIVCQQADWKRNMARIEEAYLNIVSNGSRFESRAIEDGCDEGVARD